MDQVVVGHLPRFRKITNDLRILIWAKLAQDRVTGGQGDRHHEGLLLGKTMSRFLDTSPVRCRQGNAEEHGYFAYTVAGRREEDMDEQASTRQMYDGRNLRRHWTPRTIS
jgi:hypothetical protein